MRDALGAALERMHTALKGGGRVLVHCAAGLARTGVACYVVLRLAGCPG